MVRNSKVDFKVRVGECVHLPAVGRGSGDGFRWESERRTDGDSGHVRLKCWQDVHTTVYSF